MLKLSSSPAFFKKTFQKEKLQFLNGIVEIVEILLFLLSFYSSTVTNTKRIFPEAFYVVANAKYYSCVSIQPVLGYILVFQTKAILAKIKLRKE